MRLSAFPSSELQFPSNRCTWYGFQCASALFPHLNNELCGDPEGVAIMFQCASALFPHLNLGHTVSMHFEWSVSMRLSAFPSSELHRRGGTYGSIPAFQCASALFPHLNIVPLVTQRLPTQVSMRLSAFPSSEHNCNFLQLGIHNNVSMRLSAFPSSELL